MDDASPKIKPGTVCRVPYALAAFGGALVSDWAHGVPCATQFFPPRSWRDVVGQLSQKTFPRAELSRTLEAAGAELGAPEASQQNARLLAQPETFAVMTGQQAGFLGGPMLTIHKALTAVKLARQYEREAGGTARFVPVFWVAGDDHDAAEIDHAYFLRDDAGVARVRAAIGAEYAGRSASDLFLSRDANVLDALRTELEALTSPDFAAAALSQYENKSFETAFASLLLKWLGATGLVVARSSDLRRFGAPLFARNLDDYDIVSRLIQEAGVSMRACSYEPGFSEKLRSAPHFFISEARGAARGSITPETRNGERVFVLAGASERVEKLEELRALVARAPELCTASAPLRPILQQTIFPVAAAVLGPGEMAYWAQLRNVHAHYDAVWPVIVPRATLTLIDSQGEKAIRKLGLSDAPEDLFAAKDELTRRALAGGELSSKIGTRSNAMLSEFDAMRAEIAAAGAGVDPMLEKLREKFAYELARVAEKAGAALDKSGDAKTVRAAYLSALVRPKNDPQERILCCSYFITQFPGVVERLLEVIEPDLHDHAVVTF